MSVVRGQAQQVSDAVKVENAALRRRIEEQESDIESARENERNVTALALVLANQVSPPKMKVGGWVELQQVAFRVERDQYFDRTDKFKGGKPHCSGCGVPLAVNDGGYQPKYRCPTPGCETIEAPIGSDEIKRSRGVAESYVEGVFRAVARAEQGAIVDPDLPLVESMTRLRHIPQVDHLFARSVKDENEQEQGSDDN
jgi:hypothetical protein